MSIGKHSQVFTNNLGQKELAATASAHFEEAKPKPNVINVGYISKRAHDSWLVITSISLISL